MTSYTPPPPGPPWARGNKAKDMRATIRRLLRYAKPFHKIFAFIIIIGLITTALSIVCPIYLGSMADYAAECIESMEDLDLEKIVPTASLLVILYSMLLILEWIRTRTEWVYEEKLGNRIRKDLSKKISRMPISQLDQIRIGDIMSRFVNDSDTIRLRSVECITKTVECIIMLVGCVVAMLLIDWRLTIAVLTPTILGFLIIKILVKLSQKYYRAQSKDLGRINTIVEETYRGLNIINVYNGLNGIKEKFNDVNNDLFKVSFRSRLMGELLPTFTGFVNNLGYVFVCITASLLIMDGTATFGTLVTFLVYVKLCNRPLMGLSNSLGGLQEVSAAAERIFEFLDAPEMDDESDAADMPASVQGKVEFKDVCFSYVPGTEVIHKLNLDVEPGMRVAIVGPTGAGKTTISNLLLRYYDPDSGYISIDGMRLTDVRRSDVRKQFSVVLQESWLFKGTVRQNLTFDTDVDDEHILEVCEAVGLTDYIDSLPDGLDSYLDNPQKLSSGQKQQIAIARAIIKDAPMLIMDEATSSVDTRTEHTIQNAMDDLMRNRTSFIIAHRLSTIMSADHIIVIRKGEIIERGTHDELMSKGGFYRSLYDSQFEFCE